VLARRIPGPVRHATGPAGQRIEHPRPARRRSPHFGGIAEAGASDLWISFWNPMEIPSAELAPIRELYARGMSVHALRLTHRFGALSEWANTPARLLGGRLAIQLGAARLGRWLHLRAFRDTPAHPEAIYYHARYRLERFGPLGAWKFLRSHPDQDWND